MVARLAGALRASFASPDAEALHRSCSRAIRSNCRRVHHRCSTASSPSTRRCRCRRIISRLRKPLDRLARCRQSASPLDSHAGLERTYEQTRTDSRRRRLEGRLSGRRAAGLAGRGGPDVRSRGRRERRLLQSGDVLPGHDGQDRLPTTGARSIRSSAVVKSGRRLAVLDAVALHTTTTSARSVLPFWGIDFNDDPASRQRHFNVFNFSKKQLDVVTQAQMTEDYLIARGLAADVVSAGRRSTATRTSTPSTSPTRMSRRRSGAAPTRSGRSGRSAARTNGATDSSTSTSRSSRRSPTRISSRYWGASSRTTGDRRRSAGEFGRAIELNLIEAEVPMHYLFNFSKDRMAEAVNQGVEDARAWCRAQDIPLHARSRRIRRRRRHGRRRRCSSRRK